MLFDYYYLIKPLKWYPEKQTKWNKQKNENRKKKKIHRALI